MGAISPLQTVLDDLSMLTRVEFSYRRNIVAPGRLCAADLRPCHFSSNVIQQSLARRLF